MTTKLLLSSSLFMLLLLVMACETENREHEWPIDGYVTALVDGKPWGGTVNLIERYYEFTLVLNQFKEVNGVNQPMEHGEIIFIEKKSDTIQRIFERDSVIIQPYLMTQATGMFSTSQGESRVLCDFYEVIEQDSINNWVKVDKQLGDFNEVWGSFSMHLYRVESCSSSTYPDTLLITDGKFHYSLE